MSTSLKPNPASNSSHDQAVLSGALIRCVDRQPESSGLGVVLIKDKHAYRLRAQGTSGATVVFEWCERPAVDSSLTKIGRRHTTSVSAEWVGAGFNCGGAALAWIGVAGAGAMAPATGGASAFGAAVLWGGAIAASGQCMASVYRVGNDYRGRRDINDALDASQTYMWTMRGADVVGLVGAAGALKELKTTHAVLVDAGADWKMAFASKFSRPMRRRLTTQLELRGAKRVPAAVIGRVLKQRLLDGAAGVLGMVGSAATGVTHELIVWIADERDGKSANAP